MMANLDYEPVENLVLHHVADADRLDSIRAHGLSGGGLGNP